MSMERRRERESSAPAEVASVMVGGVELKGSLPVQWLALLRGGGGDRDVGVFGRCAVV